jgi:ABC-type multidrug transport system permease subunit
LNATKNPLVYWVRVVFYVILAIAIGTVWYQMPNTQKRYLDKLTVTCFIINFLTFMALASIPAVLEDRSVFTRESGNGLYGVVSYMISNFLVSLPFIFILSLGFSAISYYLMGFQNDLAKFAIYVGYMFLTLMIAEAQVTLVAISVPIMVISLTLGALCSVFWMTIFGLGTAIPWSLEKRVPSIQLFTIFY